MRRAVLHFVLAAGFLAVAVGVALAWNSPASAYETSLYTATPTGTWIAFAVALAVAVGATLASYGRPQALAIGLGALTITSIVSLPAIRNYHYAGMGDSMTHLGWLRDILAGGLAPHELFYPGLHSIAGTLHLIGGVELERAVLLTVVFLFVPFLVFVPLVVRDVTGNAAAVGFAAIASWFVLPINNVATHMGVHTNSNALFLVPVAIFAIAAYLRRRSGIETLPFGISPFAVLAFVTGLGLLLVHPQQMVNVVVILAAISLVQYVGRRRYDDHPIAEHASAYGLTALLGLTFAVWVASNARFRGALAGLVYGLFSSDVGAGAEVGQRGASLTEIGGSIPELFAKLFLVGAIVSLLVGLFLLLTRLGWTTLDAETRTFVNYLGIALIPLTAIFVLYFVGTPTMAFRQVGFVFVILTILAGVAIAHGVGWLGGWITRPGANAVVAGFLGICLVLSLATVFSSPYIYKSSQHVSEQHIDGYETAFERGDGETPYAGFGFAPIRYQHGIEGVESTSSGTVTGGGDGVVSTEAFERGDYGDAYRSGDYYFVVTSWDEQRELTVYRQLHHSEEALENVDRYRGANKVISNDDFRMYAVSES